MLSTPVLLRVELAVTVDDGDFRDGLLADLVAEDLPDAEVFDEPDRVAAVLELLLAETEVVLRPEAVFLDAFEVAMK